MACDADRGVAYAALNEEHWALDVWSLIDFDERVWVRRGVPAPGFSCGARIAVAGRAVAVTFDYVGGVWLTRDGGLSGTPLSGRASKRSGGVGCGGGAWPMNKVLVLGGIAVVAVGLALLVLWEPFAPGAAPAIQLPGCDVIFLHEAYKLDGGVGYRDYDLICIVNSSASLPACDDVMAEYVHSKGPLPKDVDVRVRRHEPVAPDICRTHYRGDGTG